MVLASLPGRLAYIPRVFCNEHQCLPSQTSSENMSLCGAVTWRRARDACTGVREAHRCGRARACEVEEWRRWLREEVAPRLASVPPSDEDREAMSDLALCVDEERRGVYAGYDEHEDASAPRTMPFLVRATREALTPDRCLLPGARLRVRFPVVGWVDARPSGDRRKALVRYVDRTSGSEAEVEIKCKRKTYGEAWVALADAPAISAAASLPFAASPAREPGRLWAVRHGDAGWVLAKVGADGSLGQVGAPRWRVEAWGEYGRDHGEVALWRLGVDRLPSASRHVLVRHPTLRNEWLPARRENNRWWLDPSPGSGSGSGSGSPSVMVRDPTVGMPDSMGETWRFSDP